MFNWFEAAKGKSPPNVKVTVPESFTRIVSTPKNPDVDNNIYKSKFQNFLDEGMVTLRNFSESSGNGLPLINHATDCFISALGMDHSRPEPYFFLAYIASVLEDHELAMTYLHKTSVLNADMPGLDVLKSEIIENARISASKKSLSPAMAYAK